MTDTIQQLTSAAPNREWLLCLVAILGATLAFLAIRYRRLAIRARRDAENIDNLIEHLSEGIYRSTPDGRQIMSSRALVKLNGYDTEEELLAGVRDIGSEWYVEPARRDEFKALMERDGFVSDFVSEVYRHKTRERIWVSESARTVRDPATGDILYYEGSVREVTETMKRLNLEEKFSKLLREVPGALFQFTTRFDGGATVDYVSPHFERVTGMSVEQLAAGRSGQLSPVPEQDRDIFRRAISDPDGHLAPWDFEHSYSAPDGGEKWLRISATPDATRDGIVWYGHVSDITQRKKHELAITQLAYFDPLTQLPNRRMLYERLGKALEERATDSLAGAVLFIDLDNFKSLNDTMGHDVGDEYLRQIAARLRHCCGDSVLVVRIGGDEFVALAEVIETDNARATREAMAMGNRIVAALRDEFDLGVTRYRASASVGVVVFDGSEAGATEVLKRADTAMYQAKTSGRDGLSLFDPVAMERETQRHQLLADLRGVIARGGDQFAVHYQPLMNHAGHIVGAEALLRWTHPEKGAISPDRFIPMAEQFGLIGDVTAYVLREGVGQLAKWHSDASMPTLSLSVNVSVQSFFDDRLARLLGTLLERHQIDGGRLTLELTEHVMASDQAIVAERLTELKQLGVRLSLDDFGTGYSSLAHLKSLPFDELKIDGGFVADIEHTENDRALVKTILAMARTLGMSAVAEHVENARQEAFLRAYGCDLFQGYLYSKALPAELFTQMFRGFVPDGEASRPLHTPLQ